MAERLSFSASSRIQSKFDMTDTVCRFYASGNDCPAGRFCDFPHVVRGNRSPDRACRYFLRGTCRYGRKCIFDHVYFKKEDGTNFMYLHKSQLEERKAAQKRMQMASTTQTSEIQRAEAKNEIIATSQSVTDNTVAKRNNKQIFRNEMLPSYDSMFPPLSRSSKPRIEASVQYQKNDDNYLNEKCHPIDISPGFLSCLLKSELTPAETTEIKTFGVVVTEVEANGHEATHGITKQNSKKHFEFERTVGFHLKRNKCGSSKQLQSNAEVSDPKSEDGQATSRCTALEEEYVYTKLSISQILNELFPKKELQSDVSDVKTENRRGLLKFITLEEEHEPEQTDEPEEINELEEIYEPEDLYDPVKSSLQYSEKVRRVLRCLLQDDEENDTLTTDLEEEIPSWYEYMWMYLRKKVKENKSP